MAAALVGLAISKRIVEAHGGCIALEEVGPGATITIVLPVGRAFAESPG
jgi:signal transduction histidine kinase